MRKQFKLWAAEIRMRIQMHERNAKDFARLAFANREMANAYKSELEGAVAREKKFKQ
jgi:hypothetical protein